MRHAARVTPELPQACRAAPQWEATTITTTQQQQQQQPQLPFTTPFVILSYSAPRRDVETRRTRARESAAGTRTHIYVTPSLPFSFLLSSLLYLIIPLILSLSVYAYARSPAFISPDKHVYVLKAYLRVNFVDACTRRGLTRERLENGENVGYAE